MLSSLASLILLSDDVGMSVGHASYVWSLCNAGFVCLFACLTLLISMPRHSITGNSHFIFFAFNIIYKKLINFFAIFFILTFDRQNYF